ncbi:MAG: bifunctional diguanylate cyclase/phosphodiesterase, partial [Actinomycetota bacterium]|nr:bifunctional diguanylate cyclase/phosphodiesterase [Actinomycetota bacterium]
LEHAVARARAERTTVALVVVDLDELGSANGGFGETIDDSHVKLVGERIRGCVHPAETVARLDADEFAVVLEKIDDASDAGRVATRILQALGDGIDAPANVGIAISVAGTEDAEELLRKADAASQAAKSRGRRRYEIFLPDVHASVVERLQVESDLRGAVERGEFELHYQPIVDVRSGEIKALESLVRWRRAGRLVMPGDFIPAAEQAGLMDAVDRFVLFRACREGRSLQTTNERLRNSAIVINLSARQFEQPRLVEHVADALVQSGLEPSDLVLDVRERVLMRDAEAAIARLLELKALGVRIALDDFGTGYSSLSYLRRLPVDMLKIDKAFVADVGADAEADSQLARLIVQLAAILRLPAIAEGVERPSQLSAVRAIGCRLGQGYLFGRPAPAGEVHRVFRQVAEAVAAEHERPTLA